MGGGAGAFTGFAGLDDVEEEENWFENKNDHEAMGEGFKEVSIYLTDKGFGTVHRWCRTDMHGVLRFILIKDAEGYPIVNLQLTGTDVVGAERDVVFEYELPMNF